MTVNVMLGTPPGEVKRLEWGPWRPLEPPCRHQRRHSPDRGCGGGPTIRSAAIRAVGWPRWQRQTTAPGRSAASTPRRTLRPCADSAC